MLSKLIVPAALIALAACADNPVLPATSTVRADANPGIGSGAGLAPNDESAGQLGSGARADASGYYGSGYPVAPADGEVLTGQLGSGNRTGNTGIMGSGYDVTSTETGGYMGSGLLVDAAPGIGAGVGLEDSSGGILGSGTHQNTTTADSEGFLGSGN